LDGYAPLRRPARERERELFGEREAVSVESTELDERDRADLQRLASGNEAALNDLMERHGPKLFNYLIRCLQNE